jgi:glycosyltransferase involved in cell wall biosynthesis
LRIGDTIAAEAEQPMAMIHDDPSQEQPTAPAVPPRVTVVLPCLDEAAMVGQTVRQAIDGIAAAGVRGEVLVVDNGSSDGSAEVAAAAGARVVAEPVRGYGAALRRGFALARGDYVVMADADMTYDLAEISRFVAELDSGADLVMGNRMGRIEPGAMPWLHRRVGNPLLTMTLNVLYGSSIGDAHCGLRALRRSGLERLDLRTNGMELASEMIIQAAKHDLDIRELEIAYRSRLGTSKLASFRDGWRHLRLLLVHSPTYLFLIPGAALVALGGVAMLVVLARFDLLGRQWDLHALIAGALLTIVGAQIVGLGLVARTYGSYYMGARERWFERASRRFRLEHGLLLGALIGLPGIAATIFIVVRWAGRGFGELSEVRLAVAAATLVILGAQVFFTSFVLSIIGLRRSG